MPFQNKIMKTFRIASLLRTLLLLPVVFALVHKTCQ